MLANQVFLQFVLIFTLVTGSSAHADPSNTTPENHEATEFSEVIEDPVAVEKHLDVEIQLKRTSYNITFDNHSPEIMQEFSTLPADTQQRFLEKRVMYLIIMSKTLNALKYGLGLGSLVKDKLTFKKQKPDPSMSPEEKQNIERLTLKLRSHNGVVNLLKSFDRFMWSKPDFVARSNELGAALSVNLNAFADLGKIKGGGNIGIGFSIGVNIERKSVVFQIFRNIEKYRSTKLKYVGMIGTVIKAGGYFVGDNQKLYRSEGFSFYPPVAPAFYSETPTKYMVGGTLGATLPPSPFGDILTYTTGFDDKTLLKVEFSPVSKYFVQFQTINPTEMFKFSAFPINQVLTSLRYRNSLSCGRLFN
jgi:hypothetical protein